MATVGTRVDAIVERRRSRRARRASARAPSMHGTTPAGGAGRSSLARRLPRTLVLACVYVVLEVIAKAIVACQLLWLIARGRPHPWLTARGAETARYLHGMWAYLSCAEEQAPWPFAPWPCASRTEPAPSDSHGVDDQVRASAAVRRVW